MYKLYYNVMIHWFIAPESVCRSLAESGREFRILWTVFLGAPKRMICEVVPRHWCTYYSIIKLAKYGMEVRYCCSCWTISVAILNFEVSGLSYYEQMLWVPQTSERVWNWLGERWVRCNLFSLRWLKQTWLYIIQPSEDHHDWMYERLNVWEENARILSGG